MDVEDLAWLVFKMWDPFKVEKDWGASSKHGFVGDPTQKLKNERNVPKLLFLSSAIRHFSTAWTFAFNLNFKFKWLGS